MECHKMEQNLPIMKMLSEKNWNAMGKMISCSILMEVSPFMEKYKVQLLR